VKTAWGLGASEVMIPDAQEIQRHARQEAASGRKSQPQTDRKPEVSRRTDRHRVAINDPPQGRATQVGFTMYSDLDALIRNDAAQELVIVPPATRCFDPLTSLVPARTATSCRPPGTTPPRTRCRPAGADQWPDDVPVPSFGPRMRCTKCGKLGATAIPNWVERRESEPGGRNYRPL
jgi:hypothetical protein